MKKIFLTTFLIQIFYILFAQDLQKAKLYEDNFDVTNWVMSEKLDGIRAYWDGKNLYTRKGNKIYAPSWFTKDFPPFKLDGELWSGQNEFESIQSTVLTQKPNNNWQKITYNIFELPNANGNFFQRLEKLDKWLQKNPNLYLKIIPQIKIKNNSEVQIFLQKVLAKNGEGVMIKNPNLSYKQSLNNALLKLKTFQDKEGVVIGHNYNKDGSFKSLIVQLSNKTTFNLGGGFSKNQRENPPKIGSVITFKYYGHTKNGKPKFASFRHIREDFKFSYDN